MHSEFRQWLVDRLMWLRECDATAANRIIDEAIADKVVSQLISAVARATEAKVVDAIHPMVTR